MKYEVTDAMLIAALCSFTGGKPFVDDDVRDRIRDGIAYAIEASGLVERIAELEAENARLREGLDYYAKDHPFPNDGPWGVNSNDFGNVARAALTSKGEG